MRLRSRSVFKWPLRIFLVLIVIIFLWVMAMAYPMPFFEYKKQYENITVYSDKEIELDFDSVMADVHKRLSAVDINNEAVQQDVFYCHSEKLFAVFARLTLLRPQLQGFNLSIFNNSFISATRIEKLGEYTGGFPRYSIWEGSPAHIITHEIIHDLCVNQTGIIKAGKIPFWKSEGYIEYAANLYHIKKDSSLLADRIAILTNEFRWGPSMKHVKEQYKWELMAEYLAEIEKYSFGDIMSEDVTFDNTYTMMMNWYKTQSSDSI